jgi:hypothetical protein
MRKVIAVVLLGLACYGIAQASESWEAKSSPGKTNGTITTTVAGWKLFHFPNTKAEMLMIGNAAHPVAAITDYPDSVEVRTFDGDSGDFITVRDRNHDHTYEEIDGLRDGKILRLDGVAYKLAHSDGEWKLIKLP